MFSLFQHLNFRTQLKMSKIAAVDYEIFGAKVWYIPFILTNLQTWSLQIEQIENTNIIRLKFKLTSLLWKILISINKLSTIWGSLLCFVSHGGSEKVFYRFSREFNWVWHQRSHLWCWNDAVADKNVVLKLNA